MLPADAEPLASRATSAGQQETGRARIPSQQIEGPLKVAPLSEIGMHDGSHF
jgi:hypothetical protein